MNRKGTRFAGWVCIAVAVCLAVRLWPDGQRENLSLADGGRTPALKPYPREREKRDVRLKNPREEFETARKRGLTEEEVLRVVEDFLGAGLGNSITFGYSSDVLFEMRSGAQKWYLDTLVAGFKLTDSQKQEAAAKLKMTLKDDFQEYLADAKMSQEMNVPGLDADSAASLMSAYAPYITHVTPTLADRFVGVSHWMTESKLFPWDLCELDERQKKLIGYEKPEDGWFWVPGGAIEAEKVTEEELENWDFRFEGGWKDVPSAGKIFPLSLGQMSRMVDAEIADGISDSSDDRVPPLLLRVKFMTAPQLRTLLLFEPETAGELMKELGK